MISIFGRDREIEGLYQRVFESKLLLVYGVSGTGKSSLIHCGLANKFLETDWLPLIIRRGSNIIRSMANALSVASITTLETNITTPVQFRKSVRSLYLDYYKPVFFIFDQFEELFIFGNKEERQEFVKVVKSLIESDLQCKFIFVMREEYMAGVSEFEKYIPDFFDNRVRIEKMSHLNAIEVINGPCKAFNINLEEGFAEALLEKLSPGNEDVELTYLQVFLDKIFHLARNEKESGKDKEQLSFTMLLLEKTGNVSDLFGSFLEEQLSLLPDPDAAMVVLKSFVSVKGTRKQMSLAEVKEYAYTLGRQINDTKLMEMLQAFIHLRIIRDKDQNGKYELRHDALADKIYEKITLVEKEILEIRQFIENAFNIWQKRGVLLSSEDLAYISPYESKLYLSKELSGLIEKSKSELLIFKRRRNNFITAATISLILVLTVFTLWAFKERNKAEVQKLVAIDKKNESNSNLYAASSFNQLEKNPTLSFRLAEKALEVNPENISAIKAVLNSYYAAPFFSVAAEFDNELNCLKLSPKNDMIIMVPSRSDNINIWDMHGNRIINLTSKDRSTIDVKFSMDENYFVTSGFANSQGLFDKHGNLIARLLHKRELIPSDFSNDSKRIVTADINAINIWNLNGDLVNKISIPKSEPVSVALSSDGKHLVYGNYETIGIRNLANGEGKTVFGHKKSIVYVKISTDNKYILSSGLTNMVSEGNDSVAFLWNFNGEKVRTFHISNEITSTAISPKTNNIGIGDKEGNLKIFNTKGKLLYSVITNQNGISQIQFTEDEGSVYTVSDNSRNILLWNLVDKVPARKEAHNKKISSIDFSPDGKHIITSSYDSTAILWSSDGKIQKILNGHNDIVNSAQFSSDSKFVITSGNDNAIIIFDMDGNTLLKYKFDEYPVEFASFSPDNKKIAMISPANICRIIDLKGNTLKEFRWKVDYSWNVGYGSWWPRQLLLDSLGNEIKYYNWHKSYINSAGFSRDRKYVITASDDSTAKIWDLKGKEILSLKGHNNKVIDATFSRDGEKIVTVTIDNTLRIWDSKGQLVTLIKGPKESVRYAIFSSDNTKIETQSLLDTCRVYDLKGKMLENIWWERIYISSVYFSNDGNKILTSSRDGTSKLWDLETGRYIELDESPYASFSPDGKYIATISDWDHVSLWDSRGNRLLSFPIQDEIINSVKFSPDGKFILISCGNNTAKLLDLKGNEIHSFKGTGEEVTYASFSPDGKYIATANDDNSIQIWLIDSQSIINNVNNNPDSRNTWKLNIEAKQKYNIDLNYFEKRIEDSHLFILNAKSENDTIQKIKYFVKAIDCFDYVLEVAKDSLPQNELIKIKNEVSNVYKELAIISLYKRDFKDAINYAQSGLIINPANGLLPAYMAISLLYDNQFDKAKEIILTLKGKPVETGNEEYDVAILNIINHLENRGIKHDELPKLKLLITN